MSSDLQEGSSCFGPALGGSPSRLMPWRPQSWKNEVCRARRLVQHAESQRLARLMTNSLGPHGNPSIIDGTLCRLRIHTLLTIHPLQNQRAMRGQTGSAVASSDRMTLWHHRGKAPQPRMEPPWRKCYIIQAKFKPI